jgi:beta-galactosidase
MMKIVAPAALLGAILVWPAGLARAAGASPVMLTGERRISFNDGWRFLHGEAAGAEQPGFDDAAWTPVRVPHDWAIAGPFDSKLNPHTGALPISGTGWYRKSFTLPASAKDRCFAIEFDGAMANAHVWLNGRELGSRPYGYVGFGFDLTPLLHFGAEENVIAVRLTPEERSSRWYPGAGIYRNVWLDVTGPVQVARWGVYVRTHEATAERATVLAKTTVHNRTANESRVVVQTSLVDAAGKSVAHADTEASIPGGGSQTAELTLTIAEPHLWDTGNPYLYKVVSEVMDGQRVVDRYETPVGIRAIAFEKGKGFQLNGRAMRFHGVCLHHDLGALGAAVNRRAIERQLQIMKSAGVNAIRTSHNPPAPELLDLADRMGLLVIDEAFDMWRIPKVPNGYAKYFDEWSERDIRDMVRRDRNHPSVILWSIGNEVGEQGRADGWQVAKRLVDLVRDEDRTRPTTAAFDNWMGAIKNKVAEQVDVQGFNYKPNHYEEILKDHPDWLIMATESASTVSSRGVYHLPLENYPKHASLQITSYDVMAPNWATLPDVEFFYQDKLPNVLGEFVWTGFDYIGEPTPFFGGRNSADDWPSRSSYFGMVDLAGFPKDRFYLYQSVWTSKPMVHVLPHWNWQGSEGKEIPVMVYTNAEEVELFLNGRSLGRKKRFGEPIELPVGGNVSAENKFVSRYRLMWHVPYQPGTLNAVSYESGRQVAVDEVRTAGPPARIRLMPDRTKIHATGDDLSFVTVRIEDKDGNLCPAADNLVKFRVTGAGGIRAVDNGNAATTEPFQADHRKAFSGMALLIVDARGGKPGAIHITAGAEGLASARAELSAVR